MYKKGVADTVTPSHTTEERNKRDMKNMIVKGIISIIGTVLFRHFFKGLFTGAANGARHGRNVALKCLSANRASPFFHNTNLL